MSADVIRLVVVDDHPVVCRGIELLIEGTPDIEVVGRSHAGAEGLVAIETYQPDVAIVDLRLPDRLGIDVARTAQGLSPRTQVIIFTAHGGHESLRAAFPDNIRGVVLKDIDAIDLIAMVRQAADGEDVIDQRLHPTTNAPSRHPALTTREYEVLRLVASGETNKEIADGLGLTANTVKSYLKSLFQKLGARNRVEAVIAAQAEGLL